MKLSMGYSLKKRQPVVYKYEIISQMIVGGITDNTHNKHISSRACEYQQSETEQFRCPIIPRRIYVLSYIFNGGEYLILDMKLL